VAVVIVAVFALLAVEKAHRVLVVFGAVTLLWLITYFTPYHLVSFEASQEALDLNVLLLLASMMAIVAVLKTTGVFPYVVAKLLRLAGGRPVLVMALLVWFTGIISSIADNVTTVIFTTPMALGVASLLRVRPVAFVLPMVMASNIGGTATLIGDPPNILIGSGAGLSFLDFLVNLTAPVLIMMMALEWQCRRYFRAGYAAGLQTLDRDSIAVPPLRERTLLRWGLGISAVVFIGFVTHSVTGMPAAVPAAVGAMALLAVQDYLYLRHRDPTETERQHGILHVIEREIEWPTLSFFAFLFIMVEAAVQTGLIATVSDTLGSLVEQGRIAMSLSEHGTLLLAALLVLWLSGVVSSLIDNIPYVAVTIPIVASLVSQLGGDTQVLWWALSLGACLGGNGSLIGASANLTAVGLAEKAGERIAFGEFFRFGARVALMSLTISSAFLALYVYWGRGLSHLTAFAALAIVLAVRGVTWFRSSRLAEVSEARPAP